MKIENFRDFCARKAAAVTILPQVVFPKGRFQVYFYDLPWESVDGGIPVLNTV